jgi:tRNA-specific 2-thiouridylase
MMLARARYRAPSVPVRYIPLPGNQARIEWSEPQRALACGQVCALYEGDILRGGGIYSDIL